MADRHWQSLYRGIVNKATEAAAVPLPTDADLDLFEQEFGVKLPPSYRSFIQVFGPGGLGMGDDLFYILAPNAVGSSGFDMTKTNKEFRKSIRAGDTVSEGFYDDIQMMRRMIFFVQTPENDYYGWDAGDGAKSGAELPVHRLLRLRPFTTIVAPTFRAFIEDYCLKGLKKTQKVRVSPDDEYDSTMGIYGRAAITPAGRRALQKLAAGGSSTKKATPRPSAHRRSPGAG